jgi:hypothetical protein
MFLPVILLHRYGWEGFAMFAIPNVIGCTLFGYIVRTPERSKALVERYARAMSWFAIVTIAFHAFFIVMMMLMHCENANPLLTRFLPFGIVIVGGVVALLPSRVWPYLALIVWATSLAIGYSLLPIENEISQSRPWQDVIWLTPIVTFGFLFCPYLDPTFHRAIQCSPSKHAFGVFGITFGAMIGVTCLYHNVILETLTVGIGIHLVIQTLFTIGAHFREGARVNNRKNRRRFVCFAFVAGLIAIEAAHRPHAVEEGLTNDYLRFFVFYGLVFPGLVSTFMATRRAFSTKRVMVFSIVAVASVPFLEWGYIGESPWLTVLPAIALLVWLFASYKKPTT